MPLPAASIQPRSPAPCLAVELHLHLELLHAEEEHLAPLLRRVGLQLLGCHIVGRRFELQLDDGGEAGSSFIQEEVL